MYDTLNDKADEIIAVLNEIPVVKNVRSTGVWRQTHMTNYQI